MTSEEKDQDMRVKFYNNPAVIRHIKAHGTPRSNHAFRDMVASGSTVKLESKEGVKLISCLGQVVFRNHTQQINIMDKSNGKIVASIAR
jgi:hypothetical protein